jgi:hypothetical protein
VRGDTDSDGVINITDAVRILAWLFTGGAEPECLDAADTDDAGSRINITDGVYILDWLFRGGKSPPPPTPADPRYMSSECGQDLTPDQLDCRTVSPLCR